MITTRTPFRISFAGGGSDLADYYRRFGGAVLSTSINKYMYLSIHPYFYKDKTLLKYSQTELVDNIDNIKHNIIREVFKMYDIHGVDFVSIADIPGGTGLGSSSSFTVGLINLCNAYKSIYMNKYNIAESACEIEIEKLNEPIGKQDQYAAAFGGLNYVQFNKDDSVTVERLPLNKEVQTNIENNLLMFYLGNVRSASSILNTQKTEISSSAKKQDVMHWMVALVDDLKKSLLKQEIDILGEILHEGWLLKKSLTNSISNPVIDEYYELARQHGAVGGKLLGAGGGGFMLFYVRQEDQPHFIEKMTKELNICNFKFDNTGTSVIYYND